MTLVFDGTSYEPGTFVGTTPSYLAAHGYHLQEGTAFTEADVAHHARVAVIGQTVVEELFPGQDPIGQTMRANGVNFEVIGVLAAKGSNGVSNLDEIVAAPITTVQDSLAGYGPIDSITVEATSESALSSAEAEVTQILEQRHKSQGHRRTGLPGDQPGLAARNHQLDHLRLHHPARRGRGDLAAGGRHRRDEHHARLRHRAHPRDRHPQGGRRAPRDILTQFLTEAVLVSLIGGLTGVLLGVVGSQFEIAGVHPAIATYSIFLAFGGGRAHRPLLRHLSGGARRAPAADRGIAL